MTKVKIFNEENISFIAVPSGKKFINLTGRKFCRLLVVGAFSRHKKRPSIVNWLCKCECGNLVVICGGSLRSGNTKSCGCLATESKASACLKHGHNRKATPTKTYKIWVQMRQRCNNKNDKNYLFYGDRGIKVCKRWDSYDNFLADMGERPDGTSIDRIDNNGNYEPGNCRWATKAEQANNTRNNRFLTVEGICLTIRQWEVKMNFPIGLISNRLRSGWPEDVAVTTPLWPHRGNRYARSYRNLAKK